MSIDPLSRLGILMDALFDAITLVCLTAVFLAAEWVLTRIEHAIDASLAAAHVTAASADTVSYAAIVNSIFKWLGIIGILIFAMNAVRRLLERAFPNLLPAWLRTES